MPTLKDLGNGFNQVGLTAEDVTQQNATEQVKNQLGLADLINKLQQAPVDLEIKKIDQALKGNQLLQIDVDNEKKRVDLEAAKSTAFRDQAKFINEQIINIHKGFQQDFKVGEAMAATLGATSHDNKDGTVSVILPGNKSIQFNPYKISDPEKIANLEGQRRDDWQQYAKAFGTQAESFKKLESASTLGTAQGDIGMIFAYMKLLDPNSTVREGEAAQAQQAPGVPTQILNMYNRALTLDAPFFGPVGSLTRKNFIDTGKVFYDGAKEIVGAQAKAIAETAPMDNLNPKKILLPVGGVNFYDEILGQQPATTPALTNTPQPQKPGPISAGFNSTGNRPGTGTAPQPTKSLNDILNSNLLPQFKGRSNGSR